jgi:hypothetical protein
MINEDEPNGSEPSFYLILSTLHISAYIVRPFLEIQKKSKDSRYSTWGAIRQAYMNNTLNLTNLIQHTSNISINPQ